ncbi:MAG: cation:proton antiporter [Gammaproteobacteria bacterium]
MFIIFSGAAVLSTIALFTRQSLLVAYIILGMFLGPWALGIVQNPERVTQTGDIGIIFLLFLLGLHLHPQNLLHMLKKMSWITFVSSVLFFGIGFVVPYLFGFTLTESLVVGAAMMFSSTIIGLKLLPTTVLHHQHTGELMISILLMQDLLAIIVLLALRAVASEHSTVWHLGAVLVAFPVLLFIAYIFQRFVLIKLLEKFDRVQEYLFMLSIGWCLTMAELGHLFGLSEDVGAFVAGVAIATNPISLYIAESLKPLRDFFLVLFFFSIGASFNFAYLHYVAIPAVILAAVSLLVKPCVFSWLLRQTKETPQVSWEVGMRLGQSSEFALLVAYLATSSAIIGPKTSYLIQAMTIITFIVSCYIVVIKYPTPMALTEQLRRD